MALFCGMRPLDVTGNKTFFMLNYMNLRTFGALSEILYNPIGSSFSRATFLRVPAIEKRHASVILVVLRLRMKYPIVMAFNRIVLRPITSSYSPFHCALMTPSMARTLSHNFLPTFVPFISGTFNYLKNGSSLPSGLVFSRTVDKTIAQVASIFDRDSRAMRRVRFNMWR